jgi:hypothetical protein
MAPQPAGQRLKRFMDGRGFALEDLLRLSFMEFEMFLKDPEFGVSNVEILFLLRDWKDAKENLSSAPVESVFSSIRGEENQKSVPVTTKKVRFGPSSAEENSDRGFTTDLEATS